MRYRPGLTLTGRFESLKGQLIDCSSHSYTLSTFWKIVFKEFTKMMRIHHEKMSRAPYRTSSGTCVSEYVCVCVCECVCVCVSVCVCVNQEEGAGGRKEEEEGMHSKQEPTPRKVVGKNGSGVSTWPHLAKPSVFDGF